jgi:CRP/FNR family transcriptional regulator, cyclic AMP receptor protein
MDTFNARSGQTSSKMFHHSNSGPRPVLGRDVTRNGQQIFQPRHNGAVGRTGFRGGEGYEKLRNRLISHGIPESLLDELLGEPTIVSYRRGSFIFLQGAPTDLLFWVSSGLVDILCPGTDGEEIHASVLGPGEFFGFVEQTDHKGRTVQAFQARARTNVQIGLLIRAHIYEVLKRQEPTMLLHILKEIVAALSRSTLHYTQFLGKNYNGRLETVLADLALKFGVKEARGTLLIPQFGHNDFAEMIGCSRPMVSRLIAEMISAGSLAQEGKHYILLDDSTVKDVKQSSG